jgi:glycerate dehydrogenase
MRLVILDGYCLNPGDLSWDALREFATVEVHDRTPADQVVARVGDAQLAMTNKSLMPAETLRRLPGLRYIGVLATGYNIVDVRAARDQGIIVANIPTYGTASVAQFAFALLLELCHRTGMHSDAVRAGEWSNNPDWCFWKSPLVELAGKTMGIVGFGRIGRQAARIGDAIGMRILAHNSVETDPPPFDSFRWAPLEELLASSDVVSLHCPLLSDTEGMINAARLRLMKPSAFLINTSRGPLVVAPDLADALNAGVIAGAGLDVLPVEPPPDNPLFHARNCIITPHIAWATREARARLMQIAIDNVKAFLRGEPRNVVS